ncbi:RNA-binding domain-containing protein, partial [Cystobasidium minutum MCA 4210]|uniref:RNA-binding domain-containing protein n=1 Tax=Cystobasidium minutum MCA 4210 TaxID=1397322 RepID=UPI0034CD1858
PGVIYLGRIPHGFYEDEMRSYFEQFGEVSRLRLSRNRSTGASKHYAFIEFAHSGVAEIVAETMNNYLLNGHILQCRVIPTEEVHPKLWIGANRKFRPVPKGRVERLKHNAPKTEEQKEGIKKRLIKREEGKRNRLRELGIDYD